MKALPTRKSPRRPAPSGQPLLVQTVGTNEIRIGRNATARLHFSGCDYLRLSRHPAVTAAFCEAAETHGLGVAASRATTGNHPLYGRLETALARFLHAESALLIGAGYLANLAVAQALAGEAGLVLLDAAAHPSLGDAAPMFGASVATFGHRDPGDLARTLRRCRSPGRPVVLTDGLFPLSGETAPLADYLQILPPGGLLLVDDAHGLGVLGAHGRGTPETGGVEGDPRILRTATLSKALGSFGGVILGPAWLTRAVAEQSRLFRGSTPPPLPGAAAALAAVRVLRQEPARLARLRRNVRRAKAAFADLGFPQPANEAPVLSLTLTRAGLARRLESACSRMGIYARAISYPGDSAAGRFRFAISSEHTPEQIDRLVRALRAFVRHPAG